MIRSTMIFMAFWFTGLPLGFGQDAAPESRREARHQQFLETASQLTLTVKGYDEVLELKSPSLLRYSNPVRGRFNDAESFVFTTDDMVPHVVLSVSLRGTGRLMMEAVSISPRELKGKLPAFGAWAPEHGGSDRLAATAQMPLTERRTRRLVAMRRIAESLTFHFKKREWSKARLLSQPLYRYAAPKAGIADGAIFAYSESNDPEALLHVWHEVSEEYPKGRWYWLAAASTSLPLRLQQDGEVLWEKPGYWISPRPPESAYVEAFIGMHSDLLDPESDR